MFHSCAGMMWQLLVLGIFAQSLYGIQPYSEFLSFIDRQGLEDLKNIEFRPMPNSAYEVIRWPGYGSRSVKTESVLSRDWASVSLSIRGEPTSLIRYEVFCSETGVHPLVREYWFQNQFSPLGVTPKPYFVSPPVPFEIGESLKTDFTMPLSSKEQCTGEFRYMVMERSLGSVFDYTLFNLKAEQNIEFEGAIRLLGDMLFQLEIIHRNGVVHRDIHPGHILLSSEGVKITGFGRATYLNAEERWTADVVEPKYACMQSVFDGSRPSFRDDVYRAILIAAFVAQWTHTGRAYLDHCEALISPLEDVLAWKRDQFIFECPDCMALEDLLPTSLSQDQKSLVRKNLESIVDSVRSIGPGDQLPPYELLFDKLDSIADLFL